MSGLKLTWSDSVVFDMLGWTRERKKHRNSKKTENMEKIPGIRMNEETELTKQWI